MSDKANQKQYETRGGTQPRQAPKIVPGAKHMESEYMGSRVAVFLGSRRISGPMDTGGHTAFRIIHFDSPPPGTQGEATLHELDVQSALKVSTHSRFAVLGPRPHCLVACTHLHFPQAGGMTKQHCTAPQLYRHKNKMCIYV